MNELKAIIILIALEIVVIALLTAVHITGTPAVIIVIIFAIIERLVYVAKFKKKK